MDSATVNIISDCFIKPKFISEQAKKPTYFSPWDLAMINVNYIQKGLLYPLPNDQNFSITTFLDDLKDSLSATLTHFHPLAARLATKKQQNPPSLTIFINPDNSPGARFIHSSVNLTVDDILTPNDVPLVVQSFFDHHKAIDHDGHEQSLLSVQVTELIDGIFIGCSINHMVVDGASFWHFFNSWSEVFQSKRKNDLLDPISRPPVIERWVPDGSGPILTLPFAHEDEFIDRPYPPVLRERIFRFSSDSLAKLKAKVNSECNTTKISTLQSLSALVWRCVTRARRFPADKETGCRYGFSPVKMSRANATWVRLKFYKPRPSRLAVNNRSRLSPPLPDNYLGNCIQAMRVTATAGELLEHSIGWTAWRLHELVVNHGDKEIREYMDSWVKSPFVYKMGVFFDGNSIQMGSSPRFDMYGNEFGLGKGLAVLSGYANKFDGKVTLYAGREGGGSMDLEVCMLPENMAALESDEEFMSVVRGENGF
ncbi:putative quinate O-hydroxycinnamoyltransferase [Helianthus annuus]|nr:putative quinate O-hydroxycinnamoyltransferase [Helianthus annuus]KAJ0618078.1 putative quinate O-hydroxycinnamoyltransferase [Helianthus annuus]KAJ0776548.1 putative quinate O-hydroxycinnamoyltransferase [Helianthus annuus]KAJ0804750.1 putative quinate O-hydroxycinnamoyltransferase [Helianthus annuus]